MTITKLEALEAVEHGADIYGYALASKLREIEKNEPDLIKIVPAADPPRDSAARLPYFGCVCTAAGRKIVRTARLYGRAAFVRDFKGWGETQT